MPAFADKERGEAIVKYPLWCRILPENAFKMLISRHFLNRVPKDCGHIPELK
jgi:hypothetical protein